MHIYIGSQEEMYITKGMFSHGSEKLFRNASAWGYKSQTMNRVKYGVGLA